MLEYRFPFEECLKFNFTRVFIFGAGIIGSGFQEQIDKRNQVLNLGFIDNTVQTQTAKTDIVKRVGVHKPDILKTSEYDCIVLACDYKLIPEICECLFNMGICYKKILSPNINRGAFFTPNIKHNWNRYYDGVDSSADKQVQRRFVPLLEKYPISYAHVLDFPSGRGRIAESIYNIYAEQINEFICCDANNEAIDYCRQRFANNSAFGFMVNKVDGWECLPLEFEDKHFTFIYSWDAMVHFSYKWLDFYICEFYRLCQQEGYVFIHHSNLTSSNVKCDKSETFSDNPHWRSPVSANDVKRISKKHGFTVVEQICFDWEVPNLDCVTLLKKQ